LLRVTVALLLFAGLVTPQAGVAQGRWGTQVRTQLDRAGSILSGKGYEMTHELYTGSLRADEAESVTLTLHAGTAYALVGVCDNDCSDLDLRLFDADGDQVDSDVQRDDTPIVQVTPRETAQYRVKAIMAACRTSPCFYGIGVFGK
jgi:hypothetical protein